MKKHTHECLKNWINSEKTPKKIVLTLYTQKQNENGKKKNV